VGGQRDDGGPPDGGRLHADEPPAANLESSLVTETFGGVAKDEWSLWKTAIKTLQRSDPLAYVEFERMAE